MKRTTNWVAIGITVLVLLNIGLMASIWLNRTAGVSTEADTSIQGRPNPGEIIIRELGFDSAQRARFDTLRADHHSRVESYRRQMRELKERYFAGIRREAPPSDSLANALAGLQTRIDRTTYDHFRLVRALCTDAQKEKFDRILDRVMMMVSGGHPGGGRPPFDHPDGPPPHGPDDMPPGGPEQ